MESRGSGGGHYGVRGGGGGVGYRGRSRGGGGGGGSSMFLAKSDPYEALEEADLDQHGRVGWIQLPSKKEDVVIQKYQGNPGTWASQRINVSVNHFLVESVGPRGRKPAFPIPTLYHYDINYEVIRERRNTLGAAGGGGGGQQSRFGVGGKRRRSSPSDVERLSKQLEEHQLATVGAVGGSNFPPKRIPKHLAKAVLDYLIPKMRNESNHHAIATDLSFNLYTTKLLEQIPVPMKHLVTFAELKAAKLFDEDDTATVEVTFAPSMDMINGGIHTIDTTTILKYVESNGGSLKGFAFTPELRQTLEAACNAFVKAMPNFQYYAVGRSSIVPCENPEEKKLGGGLMAWKGVSANIAMGWKPYLNVDIANCAFILNKNVTEVLAEIVGDVKSGSVIKWNGRDYDEVRSLLRTCKVRYTIDGQVRGGPIRDISNTSAQQQTFFWESERGGKQISVFNYYKERYGCTLKYPNGPLLELRKQGTYVPAELCTIKAGQSYNRKLDGPQTTAMLDFAKRRPDEKVKEIYQRMKDMELEGNKTINALGIKVAAQMLNIKNARVLVPPTLRYGNQVGSGKQEVAHINPEGGTWEIWKQQERDYSFYKSVSINDWGVLVVGCPRISEDLVQNFAKCLKKNAGMKGIKFGNKPAIKIDRTDRRGATPDKNAADLVRIFNDSFRGCDFVLVVIPEKGDPLYGHVKYAAEVELDVLTQCVVQKHLVRLNDSVVQNILLKLNTKLGGINHVVVKPVLEPAKAEQFCTVLMDCPVMILGADVTHAPPGSKKWVNGKEFVMPSYAAVTGSLDPTCMPFMTEVRAQRKANAGAAEVIQDLEEIAYKMIMCYKNTWINKCPRKIIYFRDGVGEGQFVELLHIEMNAIRKACRRVGRSYEPKITFITVQKRHKTRIFYHSPSGRIENVPAGTVIDTEIVHPTETDFYLCSHKGMMGTSRPSRYHVLWDDSEFSQDQLQSLAYTLCYMYSRCTKSVKMPAATYYAHLAADRAKKLCEGFEGKLGEPTEENLNRMLERKGVASKYPMHFV